MARGPGKVREFDYSNVGTLGRRTGLPLKEGRRDEHGMEEVDGLFSDSPEKSPMDRNAFDIEEAEASDESIGSDGMSMDEDNAPGPMDFLNHKFSQNAMRPPPARSPAKSGFSASARRSPVMRSSPEAEDDILSPSPSNGKGLTPHSESRQDISPLTSRSVNAGVSKPKTSLRKTKAQLAASEPTIVNDFSDGEGDENTGSFTPENDFDDQFDDGNETVMPDDDVPGSDEQSVDKEEGSVLAESSRPAQKKISTSKPPKKGPTATKNKSEQSGAQSSRRGRPPKDSHPADDESSDTRPTKKKKTSRTDTRSPREPLDPELNRVVEDYAQRSGPLKGRSLYILKKEDPTDTSSTHTRSGRVSIRPLAYWRNERCVWGDGESAEGQRYPLSTIKEIVRTEEPKPEHSKKGKRNRKPKSKKAKDDSSDEEDEEADQWEKEGVLHGYVPKWDVKAQASTEEEQVLDIAYAPSGIVTRDVKDSTFKFAKLLSSSFIGSGVVELPPDGIKKPKNSKKMHMVFYVCSGRVQVDISGVQFHAGKGCVFQVPRGNYYSFSNAWKKTVRLFFTQGCVPVEGESSETIKSVAPGSEFEGESASTTPAAKTRGRPKGKQKAK
ncbi:hypothetical protein N7495_008897 [Penicillium taxi]|uniref:uncharacterized protein n=1 Tax=Penicillium taxi TaxID=168475 RepID=UPI002544D4BD|nr:uncharacterized protein N7495_008897 [Penicillium taxi]KAJ5888856.1 hypothetical protein N7495_008897 [Penicillium taxi]